MIAGLKKRFFFESAYRRYDSPRAVGTSLGDRRARQHGLESDHELHGARLRRKLGLAAGGRQQVVWDVDLRIGRNREQGRLETRARARVGARERTAASAQDLRIV